MTALAEQILDEAMRLRPDERRVLAMRLLESTGTDREPRSGAHDDALRAEDDPVLGALWTNDVDSVYDRL
jgi:hypothetical protein